jgi:hypothetical protein
MFFDGPTNARTHFSELEANAAAKNEQALLEHRDELPKRPSVVRRTLVLLRSKLTRQEWA